MRFWAIVCAGILGSACGSTAPNGGGMTMSDTWDFANPDNKIKLDKKLREISGIVYLPEKEQIAAIEDENGIVYLLNGETCEIEKEIRFATSGDYEGITADENSIWVLRSDGTLFKIDKNTDKELVEPEVFDTPLSEKNDTEGVCYDAANNQLLIVCKGSPHLEEKFRHKRAVYAFSLTSNTLNTNPFLLIPDKVSLQKRNTEELIKPVAEFLDFNLGDNFSPSDICLDQNSGDLLIISSIAKKMLIVSAKGEVKDYLPLPENRFKQPEGLCFAPNGDLLICNEGKDGKANIQFFSKDSH